MLQLCLQEPEVCLKQIAASAIGDIAKHDGTLAQAVCDAGCLMVLAKCITYPSPRIKRHAMCALAQVAKHSINLAEAVVETDVIPDAILHMGHPDPGVMKSAANLISEIVKHHYHMAQLVINSGGIAALLDVIQKGDSDVIFPAVLAIGYLAGQSDFMGLAVKGCKGVEVLNYVLNKEKCDHVLATIAWAIGQVGKHSPDHTEEIARAKIFPKLLEVIILRVERGSLDLHGPKKLRKFETEDEGSTEVDSFHVYSHLRAGATAGHSSSRNSQIRISTIQSDLAERPASEAAVRGERMSRQSAGDSGGTWFDSDGAHQHRQPLLPRRNHPLLLAWLPRNFRRSRRKLQTDRPGDVRQRPR
uniref:Sperm-associated antigen 6 n=1 Tax=Lygus hesperus TaxID=30085 RepID=A0A0A9YCP7_LYGHE